MIERPFTLSFALDDGDLAFELGASFTNLALARA